MGSSIPFGHELPEGWKVSFLKDLVTARKGKMPETFDSNGKGRVPYIDIQAFSKGIIERYADINSSVMCAPKDVLMVWDGARSGLVGTGQTGALGSTLMKLSSDVFDQKFLYQFLKSQYAVINSNPRGTGIPHVDPEVFWNIEAPLPPLPEQNRIVAKLDQILPRVEVCKSRLNNLPAMLKQFRTSILISAYAGRLTKGFGSKEKKCDGKEIVKKLKQDHQDEGGHVKGNASAPTEDVHDLESENIPDDWGISEMRDICRPGKTISYGILKPGPDTKGGIPYIRVADFPNNKINLEKIKRTTREIDAVFKRSKLTTGDLLISIRGTVGRIIVIPKELDGANITQDSARLSISERVNKKFIYFMLLSKPIQDRLQKAIKGVAIRGINIGDLRAIQVPIPPLEEQAEIVRRVEALFVLADRLEAQYLKVKEKADKLTQSVLAKAFRGELVPQDPSDEPASVLLERINAEKEAISAKPKKSKKVKV